MNLQLSAILFRAPWNPLYVRCHIMSLLGIVPSSPHVSAPRNRGPESDRRRMLTASPVILGPIFWARILFPTDLVLQLIFQTESLGEREIETAQLPQGSNLMNAPKIRVHGYFFIRAWSLVVTPYWRAPKRAKQLSRATIPLCFEFFRCRVDVLQS